MDSPFYRFFRRLDYQVPWETWERLPRVSGFKNEYWEGEAHLTPRPKTCDVYLEITKWQMPQVSEPRPWGKAKVELRRLGDEDWQDLPELFFASTAMELPLCLWNGHAAKRGARAIMEWTRLGRDGDLLRDSCFVAISQDKHEKCGPTQLCGAAIVTLNPVQRMTSPPQEAAIAHPERKNERVLPHLTWIFVNHWMHRRGIGTRLLSSVVESLRPRKLKFLASTCLLHNTASLLWHWRNGFVLPPARFSRLARHSMP
jgi:hypothetical protein